MKTWPKLWQNLRSSGATDFARLVPSHIAASICGHTEEIAKEHYWKVGDQDLDQTMTKLSSMHSEKLAPKLALLDDSCGPNPSFTVSGASGQDTKKPKESLGFVSICQALTSLGFSLRMGEEGSDSLQVSQDFRRLSPSIAHSIAHFDIQSLWKSLEDKDKIAVLVFVAKLKDGTATLSETVSKSEGSKA